MSEYLSDPKTEAEIRELSRQLERDRDQRITSFAYQILPLLKEGPLTRKQLLDAFFSQQGVYEICDNIEKFEKQQDLEPEFTNACRRLMMWYWVDLGHTHFTLTEEGKKQLVQQR